MILRKGFLLSADERRRRENPCRDLVLYGTREVSFFGPAPEEYPFETSPVDVLPHLEEIQRSICSFMDAEGLVKLSYVCSSWQRQSERNEWWEHLCTQKYGLKPSNLTPPPDPVKALFVMQKKMLSAMLRNQVAACAPTVHAMPAVPHSAVFG